jgi:hypothetical protein
MARHHPIVKPQRTAEVSVNSAAAGTPDGIAKSPSQPYIPCKSRQKSRQRGMRATFAPVSFCLSAAQKMQKTTEKNHAEKAGTELRIRHV